MKWSEWVDVETIKAISLHTTAVLALLLAFVLVAIVAQWVIVDETLKSAIDFIAMYLFVIVFGLLAIQFLLLLWKKVGRDGTSTVSLVA